MSITLLLGATSIAQANDTTSHTFYSIRPVFQSSMPEKVSMWHDGIRQKAREDGWGGAMQVVPFGGRSTKSKGLARFFMYGGKSDLIVASGADILPSGNQRIRDINPLNFGVDFSGSYSSNLQFSPRHSFAGVGFDYKQYFGRCGCDKRWWFEVSFPVIAVKNDVRLTETNRIAIGTQTGLFASLEDAFQGNDLLPSNTTVLQYGKINGSRKKTKVGDVEFKLGYDYYLSDCAHFDGYFGFVAPTGNKPRGEYVFEPIVGNNHHWGVMWGGSFGAQVWERCDTTIRFEFETNGRYLFKNKQTRSFDLRYRPWSRYNLVYPSAASAFGLAGAVNGINFFTQRVNVKPYFTKDINTAFVLNAGCGFEGELGYNFWARQGEKVSLASDWVTGPAVADIEANDGSINLLSNIGRNNAGADVAYTTVNIIQESDLDLDSAAHPSTISHIIYGSLGYHWDDMCYPIFIGIGGSYEFASLNNALHRWMVWGKIGVSI